VVATHESRSRLLLEEVWNLDTSEERLTEILDGRDITVEFDVNGHQMKPQRFRVEKIMGIRPDPTNGVGRVVNFICTENRQHHFLAVSSITQVR
jgi:hypothetical protein